VTRKLREAGRRYQAALASRNDAIRAARDEGMSLRAIGEQVGLSHAAVRKILDRS